MRATAGVPTDHREILLQAYAAYNNRDVEALLALVSDDVDWPDDTVRLHGKEEARAYWTEQWARTRTHDKPVGEILLEWGSRLRPPPAKRGCAATAAESSPTFKGACSSWDRRASPSAARRVGGRRSVTHDAQALSVNRCYAEMATAALPHPLPDELVDLVAERLVPSAIQRDSEGQTTVQEMKLGDDTVTWEGDGARCEATSKDDGRTLVARHQRLDEKGA